MVQILFVGPGDIVGDRADILLSVHRLFELLLCRLLKLGVADKVIAAGGQNLCRTDHALHADGGAGACRDHPAVSAGERG